MPTIQIFTNVSKSAIPTDFVKQCSDTWQKLVGKPEKWIMVHVVPDQMMSFAGSQEPCAIVNLFSIGKISEAENLAYAPGIAELLGTIGVPKDRMYMHCSDFSKENVGWNGTTFAALLK